MKCYGAQNEKQQQQQQPTKPNPQNMWGEKSLTIVLAKNTQYYKDVNYLKVNL